MAMEPKVSGMKTEVEITDIIINKPDKLSSLCRVCLSRGSESSLFEDQEPSSLHQKIMLCARVQITERDGLPSAICRQCSGELHVAYSFRIKCEYSDSLLRKFYTGGEHPPGDADEPPAIKNELELDNWIKLEENSNIDEQPPQQIDSYEIKKIRKLFRKRSKRVAAGKKIRKEIDILTNDSDNDLKSDLNFEQDSMSSDSICDTKKLKTVKKEKLNKATCVICNKVLGSKYTLQNHIATVHSEERKRKSNLEYQQEDRRFHCPECSFSTFRKFKLTDHLRVHTGERPFKCEKCSKSFSQKTNLAMHMRIHNDTKEFICDTCGKQFRHKQNYKRHQSVHKNAADFTCSICSKSLKSRETLKSHMDRHYNIKNFGCELCGMMFVTRVELCNHSKIHSLEKSFQCDICEFRTRMKKNLVKHIERHIGLRPFKCNLCDTSFYTAEKLRYHLRKHTKEKCYSCPVCLMKFCHSSSVNKHMSRIHGIQYKVNDNIDRRIVK